MRVWPPAVLVLLFGGVGPRAGLPAAAVETAAYLAPGGEDEGSAEAPAAKAAEPKMPAAEAPAAKAAKAEGPPSAEAKAGAAAILRQALSNKEITQAEGPAQREVYAKACSEAIEKLGPEEKEEASRLKSALEKAAAFGADEDAKAIRLLHGAISQTHKALTYRPTPEEMRASAVKDLREALAKPANAESDPAEQREFYAERCSQAIEKLGSKGYVASLLESALEEATSLKAEQSDEAARLLQKATADAYRVLTFRPVIQARPPKGFPMLTPIGEVQVKQYPACRMARADMQQDRPFFSLVTHFKKNKIAMTAPVQIDFEDAGSQGPREQSMAFLYSDPQFGTPGSQDSVEVVDSPAVTAVVTSSCGARSTRNVAEARDRLDEWLKANKSSFTAEGPMRVLAYNSPFVPVNRRLFEVLIPVRKVEAKPK